MQGGQFADLGRKERGVVIQKREGGVFEGREGGWGVEGVDTPIHIMMTKKFSQFSLKYPLKYFVQRFVDEILQEHLLCISSELLLYLYF